MDRYYTVFNYRPQSPQKYLNPQDIKIVSGPRIKPELKKIPGHRKKKTKKETSPDTLIMDNLETSLATTVDKACGNKS